jgi:4-hydroxy-3-methylbut-2-enyl diphosphate reductase
LNVVLSKNIGFCPGVERAVALARQAKSESSKERIYTKGRLIHNETVINELKNEGIACIEDINGLEKGDTVVVRAHGETREFYEEAERKGLIVYDATCPFVKKIHKIAEIAETLIVVGDEKHTEVKGIVSYAENRAVVINCEANTYTVKCGTFPLNYGEISKHLGQKIVSVVAQTTLPKGKYSAICADLSELEREHNVKFTFFSTQCYNTPCRLQEAEELSQSYDCVLVVGDKGSANTQNLLKTVSVNTKAYLVQTLDDAVKVKAEIGNSVTNIAVIGGASTPKAIATEIFNKMSEDNKKPVEGEVELSANEVTVETEAVDAPVILASEETAVQAAEEPAIVTETDEIGGGADENDGVKSGIKVSNMKIDNFARLYKIDENSRKTIKDGAIFEVTIVAADDKGVTVSLDNARYENGAAGKTAEGYIPASEMEIDGSYALCRYIVGAKFRAVVTSFTNKQTILSRREAEKRAIEDEKIKIVKDGKEFEFVCTNLVKQEPRRDQADGEKKEAKPEGEKKDTFVISGIEGRLGSYTIYVPRSQINIRPVSEKECEDFLGKKLRLVKMPEKEGIKNGNGKRITCSQRLLLEQGKKAHDKVFRENIERLYTTGQGLVGKVVAIQDDKGARILVDGRECWCPISEVTHKRFNVKVSDYLEVGEDYDFAIVSYEWDVRDGKRPPEDKVRLSRRYVGDTNPYDTFRTEHPEGTVVAITVRQIIEQGIICEINGTDCDGFIYRTEASNIYGADHKKVFNANEETFAVVTKYDYSNPLKKRISLSVREYILGKEKEDRDFGKLASDDIVTPEIYDAREKNREEREIRISGKFNRDGANKFEKGKDFASKTVTPKPAKEDVTSTAKQPKKQGGGTATLADILGNINLDK